MDLDLTEYVQRRIFYGSFEPAEARLLRRFLRPGDRVLDVGANVGYFTLIAARAVGASGAVVAVEPVEANADALDRNVAVNGFTNVTTRRVAVDAVDGTVDVGLADEPFARERGQDATSGHYTVGGALLSRRVPSVTLDRLSADFSPGRPVRLVKIDVEGMEERALEGFRATLGSSPPDAIMMEANAASLRSHGASDRAIRAVLRSSGYRLCRIGLGGRLVVTPGGPGITRGNRVDNVLAVHERISDLSEALGQ